MPVTDGRTAPPRRRKKLRAAPSRACEACSTPYHPRSGACPKCGAANPTIHGRNLKNQKPLRAGSTALRDPLDAGINFVERAGGFRAARAAMATLERIREL